MSGPWEDYAQESGPWDDYAKSSRLSMQPAHTPGARVMPETVGGKVKRIAREAAPTVRQTLQGVGATLGSLAGGGIALVAGQLGPQAFTPEEVATVPIGATTGGALGYAGGKRLADIYDQAVGLQEAPQSLRDVSMRTLRDIGEGYAGEITGLGLGAGIGKLADLGAKTATKRLASTALQQERGALSKQFDVPLTVGEIRGNTGLKNMETQLERVPVVGIRGFRQKQSESLKNAAERLVDTLTTGTEDAGRTIQASMLTKLQRGKDVAKQAYDRVETALAQPGVIDSVSPVNTRQAAADLLDEYSDIFERLPAGKVKQQIETIVFAADQPITFKDARFLREQLGNYISRARKSAGAVGDKEIRRLSILKSAVDEDIKVWADNSPNAEVRDAFQAANKVYQREVAPFKEFIVRKATGDEFDTDLMVKTFVKNDRPQLAAKLMRLMDEDGRAAVKHAVLKDALELGTETKPDVPFSPAKFAGKLERYGKTLKSIFSPEELTQINGFVKLSRIAERAGQFAESPPTGLRAGDIGLTASAGYGMATNPLATIGAAGSIKFMSYMLTSDTGRKLLTRAAKTPENSNAMRGVMQQIGRQWEQFKAQNPKLAEQYGKIKDKRK